MYSDYACGMETDQKYIPPAPPARRTLVLGGAGSGKSLYAEEYVQKQAAARVYLATAEAWDDEMRAKLTQHRARRDASWRTIEAPLDLPAALAQVRVGEAVLIDCLTLWLTNQMLAPAATPAALARATDALLAALHACPAPVTCVSNEVGLGIVPDTALGRRFREAQGALNRSVAADCDCVVAVMAGLPLVLKGQAA